MPTPTLSPGRISLDIKLSGPTVPVCPNCWVFFQVEELTIFAGFDLGIILRPSSLFPSDCRPCSDGLAAKHGNFGLQLLNYTCHWRWVSFKAAKKQDCGVFAGLGGTTRHIYLLDIKLSAILKPIDHLDEEASLYRRESGPCFWSPARKDNTMQTFSSSLRLRLALPARDMALTSL